MAFITYSNRRLTIKVCPPRPVPSSIETFTQGVDRWLDIFGEQGGVTPAQAKPRWESIDHEAKVYVPNQKGWARYLNLTACAVWTSAGVGKTATLISPSCAIMANHYKLANGTTVRFVTRSGEVTERKVVAGKAYPPFRHLFPDIYIVKFDEPVENCTPVKFLPNNYYKYITDADEDGIPVLRLDKQDHCTVGELREIDTLGMCTLRAPLDPVRAKYYERLVGGDSSDPCLLVGQQAPVLLTVWTYGGYGSGTSCTFYSNWINGTVRTLADESITRTTLTHGV